MKYGSWGSEVFCPNNKMVVGFQYRIHPAIVGIGDDTATNAIRLMCEDGTVISSLEGSLGNWDSAKCPNTFYICGIQTQVEPEQGYSYDDTALNNLRIQCCYKP